MVLAKTLLPQLLVISRGILKGRSQINAMVTGRPSFPLPRLLSARFPVGTSTTLIAASTRFHTSSPPYARPAAPGWTLHSPAPTMCPDLCSTLCRARLSPGPSGCRPHLHRFVGGFSLLLRPCSPHSRMGWRMNCIARHTSNGPQTKAAESWCQHANFFIPGSWNWSSSGELNSSFPQR